MDTRPPVAKMVCSHAFSDFGTRGAAWAKRIDGDIAKANSK
jgi:hypothetical protein